MITQSIPENIQPSKKPVKTCPTSASLHPEPQGVSVSSCCSTRLNLHGECNALVQSLQCSWQLPICGRHFSIMKILVKDVPLVGRKESTLVSSYFWTAKWKEGKKLGE